MIWNLIDFWLEDVLDGVQMDSGLLSAPCLVILVGKV